MYENGFKTYVFTVKQFHSMTLSNMISALSQFTTALKHSGQMRQLPAHLFHHQPLPYLGPTSATSSVAMIMLQQQHYSQKICLHSTTHIKSLYVSAILIIMFDVAASNRNAGYKVNMTQVSTTLYQVNTDYMCDSNNNNHNQYLAGAHAYKDR